MDLRLQGKIALVTGSGSSVGYGRAIAATLAQEGCDVVCADLDLAWGGRGRWLRSKASAGKRWRSRWTLPTGLRWTPW